MKKPTKVQSTIEFEKVPQWVLELVETRASKLLRAATQELSHATNQSQEQGVDAKSLSHHIGRAREIMYDADLLMQDAHSTIDYYLEYIAASEFQSPQGEEDTVDEETKTDESETK